MKFLEEFQRLKNQMPYPRGTFSRHGRDNSTNMGDYIFVSNNIYWGFDTALDTNCAYIFGGSNNKDCIDITRSDYCESCYECVDCYKCFDTFFSDGCDRCVECYFCSRCKNCQNCFGCVMLQNKQYCIFNKQYTKEEYERQINVLLQRSKEENLAEVRKLELSYPFLYKRQSLDSSNENTPYGNYIYQSINSYYVFDCSKLTDCGYIFDSDKLKNCWDISGRSANCVDCYDSVDIADCNNCYFCNISSKCVDCMYCYWCTDSQNLLGCVGVSQKENCVLNRQVDKATYEKVKQIISQNPNADVSEYLK